MKENQGERPRKNQNELKKINEEAKKHRESKELLARLLDEDPDRLMYLDKEEIRDRIRETLSSLIAETDEWEDFLEEKTDFKKPTDAEINEESISQVNEKIRNIYYAAVDLKLLQPEDLDLLYSHPDKN